MTAEMAATLTAEEEAVTAAADGRPAAGAAGVRRPPSRLRLRTMFSDQHVSRRVFDAVSGGICAILLKSVVSVTRTSEPVDACDMLVIGAHEHFSARTTFTIKDRNALCVS